MKKFNKTLLLLISSLLLVIPVLGDQQSGTRLLETGQTTTVARRKATAKRRVSRAKSTRSSNSELRKAYALLKDRNYEEASKLLFQLSYNPRYRSQRTQIKYLLGSALYELKFDQGAAFNFISVIKKGRSKYISKSIEKLSLSASRLEDDTLLNYAIKKINLNQFPKDQLDLLFFRIGEHQLRNKLFNDAAKTFGKIRRSSEYFGEAKYLQALSYAEAKSNKQALMAFEDLISSREGTSITDSQKVAAQIGRARVFYQAKKWDEAIEAYREIPRDTMTWHETLFESSWAMLRSGRFRSALSNFQSLHSSFYENYYLPESLLVRSIVYLYICKYDEMEKILNIFNRIYKPIYKKIGVYLKERHKPVDVFNEVVAVILSLKKGEKEEDNLGKYSLPYIVLRHLNRSGDFKRGYRYIKNLLRERRQWEQMSPSWRSSGVGRYVQRVLKRRLLKARTQAGRTLLVNLQGMRTELFGLFEQEAFIRYEMLNGKKEYLKKKVAGKDLPTAKIDEDNSRDYYIQNGYEYWTFQGEYWLDEIGNYHYVGTQSCE
ncbi:MAG: hypothetical protein KDD61_12780 [Bdellovibrionales bacterium]|nr:hypothetical protein [Bdellovibrionales bacterium]